jgi:hypothetical protein
MNKLLIILPSPIPELQHAPLPPKCYELGSVPWLLALLFFHFKFIFEFIKEVGGTSLAVWLSTTKSRESTQFPRVQVACNISLKSSWQGLQLCFKPHLNWRSSHKVMGPQSYENPNFGNFGTPIWESRNKMPFGCGPCGETQNIL